MTTQEIMQNQIKVSEDIEKILDKVIKNVLSLNILNNKAILDNSELVAEARSLMKAFEKCEVGSPGWKTQAMSDLAIAHVEAMMRSISNANKAIVRGGRSTNIVKFSATMVCVDRAIKKGRAAYVLAYNEIYGPQTEPSDLEHDGGIQFDVADFK